MIFNNLSRLLVLLYARLKLALSVKELSNCQFVTYLFYLFKIFIQDTMFQLYNKKLLLIQVL